MLDIAIAVLLGALTLLTAFLGVYVTLHPVESDHSRKRYKIGFCACGLFACVLIGLQAYRNTQAQAATQKQLTQIEHNTKEPPKVEVNVQPSQPQVTVVVPTDHPSHTHLVFSGPNSPPLNSPPGSPSPPFKQGQQYTVNLGLYNTGSYPARDTANGELVVMVGEKDIKTAYSEYVNRIKIKQHGSLSVPDPIGGANLIWGTRTLPVFSAEDAESFNTAKSAILVLQKARWTDDTGRYELLFARYLMAEPYPIVGQFNWRPLKEDGTEWKLP